MRICLLLFVFVFTTRAQSPREVKNPHTSAADVAAGAKIFRGHCAECHGLKGEGGRGPNLTTGVFYHGSTDADLLRNITDGIPGTTMPSVFFSEDQVWQIVAYVRTLSARRDQTIPGDAAKGARLYASLRCAGCHLVRGEGGTGGPDLTLIGSQRSLEHLREAILDPNAKVAREFRIAHAVHENNTQHTGFVMNEDTHYLQLLEAGKGLTTLPKRDLRKQTIEYKSVMPSYRGKIAEQDLDHLVAYLSSLRRSMEGASK